MKTSSEDAAKKKVNLKELADSVGKSAGEMASAVSKKATQVAEKTKETALKSQQAILGAVDMNGNGEVDIEDVIIMGMKVPGIRIDRAQFLQKELQTKCSQEVIDKAIASTPLQAGISCEIIDHIADEVIKFERTCVSGISAALGAPGGLAMVATIPADIAQYYGYMLRATQKLMYLYGFPAINVDANDHSFDTETLNVLIICLGVMYGAAGANNALKGMAKALAAGVEKKIMKTALTKGTLYPIVKSVAKWFNVKMTKELLSGYVKKAIPVVGGVIGGTITFFSFKPCCDRLKGTLQNTMLSNPNYIPAQEDDDLVIADEETVMISDDE